MVSGSTMRGMRSWLNRASAVKPVAAVSLYPRSLVWTMKVTRPITVGEDLTTTMKDLIGGRIIGQTVQSWRRCCGFSCSWWMMGVVEVVNSVWLLLLLSASSLRKNCAAEIKQYFE